LTKRDEQKEYRKQQILHIALDQFIIKGFYGTSTREIAKIAGVSSGLMFHYFESKERLYETLIEIGCSKMVFEDQKDLSPIMYFEQQVQDLLQLIANNPFAAKMFVFMGYAVYNAAGISKKAGDILAQHDITTQSVPLIQKGQELGEIRLGNPHALSIAFWCSIQGIAEEIALNQNSPVPKAEWILDILKNKKDGG
jgi:TetR/AcrR family transcriptional regulator